MMKGRHATRVARDLESPVAYLMAEEFEDQFTVGAPTNDDETALRRLTRQLRCGEGW
jgi:hypothetical protein